MKCCAPLLAAAALAATLGISDGQTLVDGTNYSGLFGPNSQVTVTPPTLAEGTLLDVHLGGSKSGDLGDYWYAQATGGAVLGSNLPLAPEVRLAETGAQVALNNGGLDFRISNNPDSVLGSLGVGLGLALTWSATATFDAPGEELLLLPGTIYQVSFDVDGSNGLLKSTLGILPTFGLEMLDGNGNPINCPAEDGTLVNVIGLELLGIVGSPPESGRAVVQFQTGASVPTGPAGLRFTGSAVLPATALNLGTNFARVSNISVTQVVPEPSAFTLGLLGAAFAFRRRR
ncbi:PEP-CTERM sorting domain-containing protein [Haloferula sp. BvORR071]|uniref:PEP-CTERM sorting domain-containing protein n=1 Tax=Haloferula sp. BvORR071 TaxID=1396141 RepID=UPI00055258BF|nr:PEP-CTERM sorting domain-containing protein [Haloferula sp. BvORR071]